MYVSFYQHHSHAKYILYGKIIDFTNDCKFIAQNIVMNKKTDLIETQEKVLVEKKSMIIKSYDIKKLYGRNKIDPEKMFKDLQKKLEDERMFQFVAKNPQYFNYILKNDLINQVYPTLFYYFIDEKTKKPCLPRCCRKSNYKKPCDIIFDRFEELQTLVLDIDKLYVMCTAIYKCKNHENSTIHISKHDELMLQPDIGPSKVLLKIKGRFITVEFFQYLMNKFLINSSNELTQLMEHYSKILWFFKF